MGILLVTTHWVGPLKSRFVFFSATPSKWLTKSFSKNGFNAMIVIQGEWQRLHFYWFEVVRLSWKVIIWREGELNHPKLIINMFFKLGIRSTLPGGVYSQWNEDSGNFNWADEPFPPFCGNSYGRLMKSSGSEWKWYDMPICSELFDCPVKKLRFLLSFAISGRWRPLSSCGTGIPFVVSCCEM